MNGIESIAIAERQVEWVPKGWDRSCRKLAIVRDGRLTGLSVIEGYFVDADPGGAVEFFQTIKRVMAETKKKDDASKERK